MNDEFERRTMGNFNIISLFSKEVLENIQDKISKATGLAFVTVDYKGEPVTELTSFTEFCKNVRRSESAKEICMSSDAYGAIRAAVTCKAHVYLCPCGLLEIAIPIIIGGQYLGGFIGGQIRCTDIPKMEVVSLKNLMHHIEDYMQDEHMSKLFNEITEMSYEKFVNIAELVSLIITQLGEKELSKFIQKEYMHDEMERLNEKKKLIEMENNLKDAELRALKAQLNPHFLFNCLSSISNLAVIENAEKTNEMTVMFAEFLRYNLKNSKSVANIVEEINNIENYLCIQKIRLGERLKYCIKIDEGMNNQKIPCHIIMPFVENSVLYGIVPKEQGGTIKINVYYKNEDVVITVEDDGPGMSSEKFLEICDFNKNEYSGNSIGIGISNTRKRLIVSFGKEYDIVIKSKKGKGTLNIIKYPKDFDEGIV